MVLENIDDEAGEFLKNESLTKEEETQVQIIQNIIKQWAIYTQADLAALANEYKITYTPAIQGTSAPLPGHPTLVSLIKALKEAYAHHVASHLTVCLWPSLLQ